ncbi:MAG TPA: TolC family protein [Pyrinomonadaceae bacterium]|jgi:HAE1 family hydrophobic/amphiphilic exporter-1
MKNLIFSIIFVFCASVFAWAQNPTTTTPPTQQPQQQNPQQNPQTQQQQRNNTETQQPVTSNPTSPTQTVPAPAQQQQQPSQTNPSQTSPSQTVPATPVLTPGQTVGNSSGVAPAQLPDDVPPIAPNFEAPVRPLPSAERVGVDVANQLPISLQDAITLALQNNNDIDSSRIGVTIAEFNLRAAQGVYDPNFTFNGYYESRTTPTASTIGGASGDSVTQRGFFGAAGVNGFSRVGGGSYNVDFSSSRTDTTNLNATLRAQYPTVLTATFTQPLFRGRRIDNNRRTIEIAKKNLSLSDAQFRQRAIEVIAQVEQAYWDLAYALRNLQVQIDAVKQARLQLESNQRLVSKGVLAPIEITAANAQITSFEQNVYTAQQSVTQSENTLKTLMLPDRSNEIWTRALVPVSPVELEVPKIPLEQAISAALTNRQEIAQLQTNTEINKINEKFYRDQTKPQIDLVATYTGNGLAGIPADPRTVTTSALTARVNELSALEGLPPLTTVSNTTTVPPRLNGGVFKSLTNLFTAAYPTYNVGVQISFPFGNTTAKANLGRTLAEGTQIENTRAQTEQTIEADVRNGLQTLRSAEARLQAAAATRASAEQLYESEQRQFRAGTSTVYLVFQRQTTLISARAIELQAQTDLNKAISTFQRVIGTTLTANSVEITDNVNAPRFNIRRPFEFGSRIFTAKKNE